VDIHPFNDGNGRSARLLMNAPVAVRPEDRLDYIRGLQEAQAVRGMESFRRLLCRRLDATLDEYLIALQEV
jgi:Fic family protein